MNIPIKFTKTNRRTKAKKHYEYVAAYPNHIQYRCKENGRLECFQRSYFKKWQNKKEEK